MPSNNTLASVQHIPHSVFNIFYIRKIKPQYRMVKEASIMLSKFQRLDNIDEKWNLGEGRRERDPTPFLDGFPELLMLDSAPHLKKLRSGCHHGLGRVTGTFWLFLLINGEFCKFIFPFYPFCILKQISFYEFKMQLFT